MIFHTLCKLDLNIGDKIKVIDDDNVHFRDESRITSIDLSEVYYYNSNFTIYGLYSIGYQKELFGVCSDEQLPYDIKRLICSKALRIIPI
jgi:hypothetical protein